MSDDAQDLSFKPVDPSAAKVLMRDQVRHYNSAGFVQPFRVFDAAEINGIRTYLDGLMADMGDDGAYGINCYQSRLSGLWDIATNPRILDLVEDIIGPDILCWASAIFSKSPGDPKAVGWHQDAAFWKLNPAQTVTVWLAIDDADPENSAMRFIPGTHKLGAMKVRQTEGSVLRMETEGAEALGEPFTNRLKAGEISMHADMLVHGSLPNTSDRRRCGLTLRYCPPSVEITDPKWANGVEAILCRGLAGTWPVHARPDNNDITKTQSPHVFGNN